MKKSIRFHIGDHVHWNGSPNEFRDNRSGYIVKIKKDKAYISDNRWGPETDINVWIENKKYKNKLREVPLNILKKY